MRFRDSLSPCPRCGELKCIGEVSPVEFVTARGCPRPGMSERYRRYFARDAEPARCWLAERGVFEGGEMPPCEGRGVKAHLIPQQLLKRLAPPGFDLFDPRVWRWACGGVTGIGGHHGAFDASKRLRVPFEALGEELLDLAEVLGGEVEAFIVRTYLPFSALQGV